MGGTASESLRKFCMQTPGGGWRRMGKHILPVGRTSRAPPLRELHRPLARRGFPKKVGDSLRMADMVHPWYGAHGAPYTKGLYR